MCGWRQSSAWFWACSPRNLSCTFWTLLVFVIAGNTWLLGRRDSPAKDQDAEGKCIGYLFHKTVSSSNCV